MEIGVRNGDSVLVVLKYCIPKLLVLADNWGGSYGGSDKGNHSHIEKLLEDYNGVVCFLDGDSKVTLPTLNEKFDLILVDGDHSFQGATADLNNCLRLMKDDGFIIFDDIAHEAHKYLVNVGRLFAKTNNLKIAYETTEGNGTMVFSH